MSENMTIENAIQIIAGQAAEIFELSKKLKEEEEAKKFWYDKAQERKIKLNEMEDDFYKPDFCKLLDENKKLKAYIQELEKGE